MDTTHGMALVRRAAAEHRRLLMVLAAGVVVNLLVYVFLVRPLADRVANVAQRERAAEQAESLKKACRKKPFLLSSAAKINVDNALRRIVLILQGQGEAESEEMSENGQKAAGWSPLN